MPRPFKCRQVNAPPAVREFRPCGVPEAELQEARLPLDGLEALRLVDLFGLDQGEAASRMGISRQTLGRILAAARGTVATALVSGLALRITDDPRHAIARPSGARDVLAAAKAAGRPARIAISAAGPGPDASVHSQFGRATGFAIADAGGDGLEYLVNETAQAEGAGIAAAERLARAGVALVLTGSIGFKAYRALASAGIAAVQGLHRLTVREAVERCRDGKLDSLLLRPHERVQP